MSEFFVEVDMGFKQCLALALFSAALAASSGATAKDDLQPAVDALKKGESKTAIDYLLPRAKAGNAEAQFMLVSALQTSDRKQAGEWLFKAAENRHPSACHIVGLMYQQGNEVAEDPQQAVKWLTCAAEGGIAAAQMQLGLLYRNGPNALQSDQEAAKWMSKAANAGNAEAQYQLAEMYRYGYGVKVDAAERGKWLRRAATQGHVQAAQALGQQVK